MKRSRIASVVLAIAVVMSMTFTSGIGAFAGTVTNGTSAAGTIAAQDMNSTDDSSYISYTAKAIKNSSAVVPVTVKSAGTIIVPLQGIAVGKNLTVSMHTDTAATDANKIGYAKYLSSSTVNDVLTADVAKAGTYYLKFDTWANVEQSADFQVKFAPAEGILTSGRVFYGSSADNSFSYYKITVPGNGYLKVTVPEKDESSSYHYYYIKLTNSGKKNLLAGDKSLYASNNYTSCFGVKKGTYYVAVKNSDKYYGLKVTFISVKENSGNSKSKAKSISKGSTKKGVITANQKAGTGEWYKFVVKKTQKITLKISTKLGGYSGGIKFAVYKKGDRYPFGSRNAYDTASGEIQPYTFGKGEKLAAGTYYIKVEKYSDGNGYYSIKWK